MARFLVYTAGEYQPAEIGVFGARMKAGAIKKARATIDSKGREVLFAIKEGEKPVIQSKHEGRTVRNY